MKNEIPVIDGYEDFRLIGEGGYSKVYDALQVEFNRRVAVKVLDIDETRPFDRAAFEGEYRSMGTVSSHPNIVTIFASGFTEQQQPYLTMELYSHTLLDRIRDSGPMPHDEVLDLGERLALALERAHADGIVHCDVKPQNVFFSEYGEPALGDFGIAAVMHEESATLEARGLTPNYAAPEVLAGGPPSVSTDLYALGATLYTALAGYHPFRATGEGEDTVAERVAGGELPAAIERTDLPEEFDELVVRLMAPDSDARPPSATAVALELAALQGADGATGVSRESVPIVRSGLAQPDDSPTIARTPPKSESKKSPLVWGVIVGALGLFLVLFLLNRDGTDELQTTSGSEAPGEVVDSATETTDAPTTSTTTTTTTTTTTPTTTTLAPAVANVLVGEDVVDLGCNFNKTFTTGLVSIDTPEFDGSTVRLSGENVSSAAHAELRVREINLDLFWNGKTWERSAESVFVPVDETWEYEVDLPDGDYCIIARGRDRGNGATDRGETIAFSVEGSATPDIVAGNAPANTINLFLAPPNGSFVYVDAPKRLKLTEDAVRVDILREDRTPVELPAEQLEKILAKELVELDLEPGFYFLEAYGEGDNTEDLQVLTVLPVPEDG